MSNNVRLHAIVLQSGKHDHVELERIRETIAKFKNGDYNKKMYLIEGRGHSGI